MTKPRGSTCSILVALEPVDGRKGIDSLVQLCREKLINDPFSGCLFFFRSRQATSIRALIYDGQGFWLAQKRLSKGRFVWWPRGTGAVRTLEAYQAQLLLAAGNPDTPAAPLWRHVNPQETKASIPKDTDYRSIVMAERMWWRVRQRVDFAYFIGNPSCLDFASPTRQPLR